jgi:hypothetical protein
VTTVETVLGPMASGSDRDAAGEALPPELLDELMAKVKTDGVELLGDGGLLSELTKKILERALGEELTGHVGYDRGDPAGRGSGNSRNGTTPKRVLTEIGAVDLDVPRLAKFNENVIALYAGGMSTRDIRKTLKRMYSVEVCQGTVRIPCGRPGILHAGGHRFSLWADRSSARGRALVLPVGGHGFSMAVESARARAVL